MLITNATLLTVTPPPTPDADGGEVEGVATASGKRVLLDQPKQAELIAAKNKVLDADAMLYVELVDASAVVPGGRVSVQQDGLAVRNLQVLYKIEHVLGGLSHAACFCKGL